MLIKSICKHQADQGANNLATQIKIYRRTKHTKASEHKADPCCQLQSTDNTNSKEGQIAIVVMF